MISKEWCFGGEGKGRSCGSAHISYDKKRKIQKKVGKKLRLCGISREARLLIDYEDIRSCC